ncbi:MAG: hypothetical protein KF900_05530 [Bacteroidetes bacterium]|nr:hypothetical protein [Bacteroidota bacterium]
MLPIISLQAQESNLHEAKSSKDYKNPEQFENFQKRRTTVSEWQINQLKKGAIVVRLQTNQKAIDALNKAGNEKLAQEKTAEQFAVNKNILFAYTEHLNFCKVYFIYAHSSDTLLKGARSGIFLDTNLIVNPTIEMTENFYLIAERDYAYNSSIGFVPEDSARFVSEQGNPIKEMAIVLKNKYAHQLKKPFPYVIQDKVTITESVLVGVSEKPYTVDRTLLQDLKQNNGKSKIAKSDKAIPIKIKKELTYERISLAVDKLNSYLHEYYKRVSHFDTGNVDKKIIPFLY